MRIVEVLVGINALLGIATYLGIRASVRRVRRRLNPPKDEEEQCPLTLDTYTKNYEALMQYYDFDGLPIDQMAWAKMFESEERIFGRTNVNGHDVSTVWLGIDHGYGYSGPPLIFETMVFCKHDGGDECDWGDFCERYASKEAALIGHAHACNNVLGELKGEE